MIRMIYRWEDQLFYQSLLEREPSKRQALRACATLLGRVGDRLSHLSPGGRAER
jgi:hypothetical protein